MKSKKSKKTYFGKDTLYIKKELVTELLRGCKNAYPKEFFAMLSSESRTAIDHYIVVPLFYQTENAISYRTDLLPMGYKISGTIHSHPSGINRPSNADLRSFINLGSFHIIVGYPFSLENIACYDYTGKPITLILI